MNSNSSIHNNVFNLQMILGQDVKITTMFCPMYEIDLLDFNEYMKGSYAKQHEVRAEFFRFMKY